LHNNNNQFRNEANYRLLAVRGLICIRKPEISERFGKVAKIALWGGGERSPSLRYLLAEATWKINEQICKSTWLETN